MGVRRWHVAFTLLAWLAAGCGNALYAMRVTQATAELQRAEQLDAAHRAPYEYFYALEHLKKARTEAVEADFADAAALAEIAYQYAERAIQISERVEPAAPSPRTPERP